MNKRVCFLPALYLMLLLALTACAPISADAVLRQPAAAAVAAAAAAPRTLNVLVGAGQDTIGVNAFLPAALRVRVGDTVTWNLASDEIHTVSFLGDQPLPVGVVPAPRMPRLNTTTVRPTSTRAFSMPHRTIPMPWRPIPAFP